MIETLRSRFPRFALARKAGYGEPVEHIEPPASDEDIEEEERVLGVPLPDSYKDFLRCTRGFWLCGGTVQFGTQHPFFHDFPSLEELMPVQRRMVEIKGGQWPPPSEGMLCFAEFFAKADGDQVLFDVSNGLLDGEYPVFYYSHESIPPSVRRLTSSFHEFIEQLFSKQWFEGP